MKIQEDPKKQKTGYNGIKALYQRKKENRLNYNVKSAKLKDLSNPCFAKESTSQHAVKNT